MNTKEMRDKLRADGHSPARSNKELSAQYESLYGGKEEASTQLKAVQTIGDTYTYVGAGEDSPGIIKFMGLQVFQRGKETKVSNPVVLDKIRNNPSFIKGSITPEDLYERDEKAKKAAQAQREEDTKVQIAIERQQRKLG